MKIIKRLLYFILGALMLLCAVILVCAFNPSLTDSLASVVSKSDSTESVTGQGEMLQTGTNQPITGMVTGQTGTGIYVPPAKEDVVSPDSVKDKNGYEPVQENGQEIADEDAEDLQEKLKTGETGEKISFNTEFYPYYGMLNQDLQALYKQIYANALECNTSFAPVVEVSVDQVMDVFEAVFNDHPELFWVETGYSCKYLKNGKCIELTLQYHKTADDLEEATKQFEKAAQEIIEEAEKLSSDYEKERYVHDALIKKVDYHPGSSMGQSAYSALVSGRSVCAGYARAYQYMMIELGIPCYYCAGYSGEDHAWNIVKLDDGYYNVDVTWDDTEPSTYDYFNKTDADYANTHMRRGLSVYLPVCNSEKYRKDNSDSNQTPVEGEDSDRDTTEGTGTGYIGYDSSEVDALINDYPQKPLTWENEEEEVVEEKEEDAKKRELEELGLKEEEILDNLEEYYADCLAQMKNKGTGFQQFTNVIPKSLWATIELIYSNGSYEQGYVEKALEALGMEHFAIQLQTERLSGNYYRIYHNISTWTD